ncbi:hypothetical protein ACF08E_10640 [Streptomyces globisporus]|uniref:LexA family protein n=1 Tax=Streptomyces globisporus TaxID=1908 RepID=UPI0036F82427
MRWEPRALTARQEAVLAVIRSWLAERGHGPTVREIGGRVGLSSTSSVAHQLGRLEARGLISRTGRDWSTCVLVEGGVMCQVRGDVVWGSHSALIVGVAGGWWLADAGMGDGFTEPVQLREGAHWQGCRRTRLCAEPRTDERAEQGDL